MPITRKQFEIGIDEELGKSMKRIYDFFVEHKDAAFTYHEVWEALYGAKELKFTTAEGRLFLDTLSKLEDLAVVERRKIRDKSYYACGSISLEI